MKTISNETVNIQVFEAEHLISLIKELVARHAEYHTFRPKNEKTFRFVLRGMHHATEPEAIKEQLYELGHVENNIHNKKPSYRCSILTSNKMKITRMCRKRKTW